MTSGKLLVQILGAAYWLLLLPVIEYSADLMFVQAIRNQKLDFKDLLAGFRNYLDVVLAYLLTSAIIWISASFASLYETVLMEQAAAKEIE